MFTGEKIDKSKEVPPDPAKGFRSARDHFLSCPGWVPHELVILAELRRKAKGGTGIFKIPVGKRIANSSINEEFGVIR